jgi:oxygen-independent coproporphyrinogen-3 oxidase
LTIEPGTAFGRYYKPGDQPLPTDEMTVNMYRMGQKNLTSCGYEHYEISNYARPEHQCRHNRVYWENRPYYGFGMGAASYTQGKRFTRPRQTQKYYQWVEDGAVIDCEVTPPIEELLETLMLGLRLASGLSLQTLMEFDEKYHHNYLAVIQQCLQPYFTRGWVEVVKGRLKLTDPEGFLFSNVVLATLFKELGE